MMDLNDLQVFVRVAELRSISGSARALDAPKSTVSRSLTRLEAAVGSVLVERSTRQLRLTDTGQLLLPHAMRIIDEVNEAANAVGRFVGTPRGRLRVSVPYALALGVVTPMLPSFLARYPELDVVLERDGNWADFTAGDADLIIRTTPLPETAMIGRRIGTVELWTCASPSYIAARGSPATPDDLGTHDVMGLVGPDVKWSFVAGSGQMKEVVLRTRAVLPDPVLIERALVSGAGIGQLPDLIADEAIRRGELTRLLPDFGPATSDAFALYPSHRGLSIKVRVFIDALVAYQATRRASFKQLSRA